MSRLPLNQRHESNVSNTNDTPLTISSKTAKPAVLASLAILGMPGAISSFASAAPTVIALGAPLELLPILIAVDVIPDMFRTVANVTHDVAATAAVTRPTVPPEMPL